MPWADSDAGTWTSIGATVANAGFAAFVAWYLLTKVLPKVLEQSERRLEALQDKAERHLTATQEKYDLALAAQRQDNRASLESVIAHCERDGRAARVEVANLAREVQNQGEVLEEVRDALRELNAGRRRRGQPPPKGEGP